jgi:hypothetical protein
LHSTRVLLLAIAALTLGLTGCGINLLDTVQDVLTEDARADLRLKSPDETALTCRTGPSVVITVENRGDADAPESVTTFVFVPGGSFDVRTAALKQSESIQLDPVAVPSACFVPDCRFAVLADASFVVDETDEGNNRLDGNCPAAQ